jgi:hypothetical protein
MRACMHILDYIGFSLLLEERLIGLASEISRYQMITSLIFLSMKYLGIRESAVCRVRW